MGRAQKHIDRHFLFTTLTLVFIGVFVFSSASLGLLARGEERFSDVIFSQFILGLGGGLIVMTILMRIPYRTYRTYAPHIFGFGLFLTSLVFLPVIGVEANGARRWLSIFGISFQPAEFLKIAFVIFMAWYYSMYYRKLSDIKYALGGLILALSLISVLLLLQPDIGTFLIIGATGVAIAITAGIQFRYLSAFIALGLLGIVVLVFSMPYVQKRVETLLDPSKDPDASYQINQSLIGIGSGGLFGRGFGQGVQKFTYLPEPSSDSIFSVAAEEFGFFGSVIFVLLYVYFALRGLFIASRAPDRFGGLIVVGIVILITTQSFINIGSVVGLIPFTGEPLTFISHGGTSLMFTLAGVGIVLNISRYKTPRRARI